MDESTVWELDCGYSDGPHVYPGDWVFGGPYHTAPQADTRWLPTTYQYRDDKLSVIHITQTPLCDEQAIDEFTRVASWGPTLRPKFLEVKRPGEEKFTMLPVEYDVATDTARDLV